jgi:glutamate synthase (NADPH) small chain
MERMDPRELQDLERLCVQDDAPFCQAACPLHVDVRTMLEALAQGDFERAARTYAKKAPLPALLSRICDQPCGATCKRGEAGGAINIQLLERSCAEMADFTAEPLRHGVKRTERVAVVGGGLSGMTAAAELTRKGYPVTIFECGGSLGARLRELPQETLPSSLVDEEVARLERAGVDIRTGVCLGRDVALSELLKEFRAVYLGIGPTPAADSPLVDVMTAPNPVTLATGLEGVFAAGSSLRAGRDYSPVLSVSDGWRAAVSIDRFLKGEALTPLRDREGPYQTRLYTSLAEVETKPPVPPRPGAAAYLRDEATSEASRCLQCECLECVRACTYLDHFNEYPGKCIRKVTKNVISVPGKSFRTFTKFINACALCGLCGTVCPTDLDMGLVNAQARRIMCDKGFMPPAIHDFAIRDMEASSNEPYGFARNQPGFKRSSHLFFPGCQLSASAPLNVERAYLLLAERLIGGVGLMLRCCGAPALWAGRQETFDALAVELRAEWERLGRPTIILACPTCQLMFERELPDLPVVSLWEVLDTLELPGSTPSGQGRVVAVHDSCTARNARTVQNRVRSLLTKLGFDAEELPWSRELTKCCGYGGLLYRVNPGLADEFVRSRVNESPSDYVTYCSNCRDFFAAEGKPAYHLLDLLFDGHPGKAPARRGPSYSMRRENRRFLARKLLGEIWGEAVPEDAPHVSIRLHLSPEMEAKMDRESILAEDVQRVIFEAENSGNRLFYPDSGRYLAHYRPGIITYWVEYSPEDDGFLVHNTYSHRMKLVKDGADNES